jgi:xanthine dehydrogenase accessory factor
VHLIETRRDAPAMLEDLPSVSKRLTALPEDVVAGAEPGSAFVVLTHDHALDFLIASACLKRQDAAYMGMIGSKTKRASFDNWSRREGHGFSAELICPMAPDAMTDKRPEVLAVNFASEIMQAFSRKNQEEWSEHVDQAAN